MLNQSTPLQSQYSVIVIGGGSVGLSLAAELGWRGISCLVVEERDGLNPHPRANAVANRTMEYYRRWGIDKAITDAGIPPSLPAEYLWVSSLHGREIHRVSLPPFSELVATRDIASYAKDEHNWSPYLKTITGQNEVEEVLLDYVASLPSVDFRFGYRLIDFEEQGELTCDKSTPDESTQGEPGLGELGLGDSSQGDSVQCQIEDIATGKIETVKADYLVGCDGARSVVRHGLGIEYAGTPALASFVSVFFRAPEMINKHSFGHGNIFFPLHRDYRGFLLTWDHDCTYTYHLVLDDGQDWSDIEPLRAIRELVDAEFEIEMLSVQPWTAHALVAEQYTHGRVALAGDAAHLFSPTGGFGMNTGVSDAIDLAWKLEALLKGWGGPRLLGSYHRERQPIGRRNTQEAADCFHHLFAVMQHGAEIDDESAAGDELRRQLGVDIKAQEKLIASSGTLLGYRYEGSDIIVADNTVEPADDPRRYSPVARPGHRAPHAWLENGDALYDRFGAGFTLLHLGARDADVAAFRAAAMEIGMPLEVLNLTDPYVSKIYQSNLILIRPDLMIAWRENSEDDKESMTDARAILDCVRGS